MPKLFAVTLFVSAGLMFAVQPMIAKMILPRFGGTPAVWNTCMVFFQAVLLAGYGYVHIVSRRLTLHRQLRWHLVVLAVAAFLATGVLLPLQPSIGWAPDPHANPIPWLLGLLTISVGVPFFALSASAPLLQKWFAAMKHESAPDPYFLYAASNLGSMLALLSYPVLIEPGLPLAAQAVLWMLGYAIFLGLTAICALKTSRRVHADESPREEFERLPLAVGIGMRLRWLALAFVPSSLLYGVTSYLTTDIAAVPLLWVLPLAIYLLTFIIAFARKPLITHARMLDVFPLAVLWQVFVFSLHRPIWLVFVLHLVTLFVVALVCHGELARLRPSPRHLTAFYLWLAAGGVLGGAFNTLIAPVIFDTLLEYPLVLVLAALLIWPASDSTRPALDWHDVLIPIVLFLVLSIYVAEVQAQLKELSAEVRVPLQVSLVFGLPAALVYFFHDRPIRFGLSVGALLLTGGMTSEPSASTLVYRERSFFGMVKVVDQPAKDDPDVTFRRFIHGNTLHGMQQQSDDAAVRRRALSYYFRNGPMGDIFAGFGSTRKKVAVLGLGAGALAGYAEPGQSWTFYEIDPAVQRIAETYFTFLEDAQERGVSVDVILGDARLALASPPSDGSQAFDLIIADAFSSDAVPVHLLTRETLALYVSRLMPDGVLVFNVTNRYLDLEPVMAALADDAGLTARIREEVATPISADDLLAGKQAITEEDKRRGKTPSRWVIMARTEADLGAIADNPRWRVLQSRPDARVWTDDYSNLLGVLRW